MFRGFLNDRSIIIAKYSIGRLPNEDGVRLCIAKKLASAVTYLHTALPSPVIHRDLKPGCIFFNHDHVPKLSNFSLSITIPPTYSDVEDGVRGTIGYLDPAYMRSGCISEKTNVCSFGVLLLVLLAGRRAWLDIMHIEDYTVIDYVESLAYQLQAIVDPNILEEVGGNEPVEHQLHDFLELALSCTQERIGGRPFMGDVARELVQIDKSILPSYLQSTIFVIKHIGYGLNNITSVRKLISPSSV
ncbi:hypothetical protein L3X38_044075 [Prunus dulcis]|uniref:Protein kinase domain-containing protein n=1 Tax=Prunus dulcis TaxID=3755 RepID=A0AAD4UZ98_PRUDU|nr:hypothetical protein L3X38_044075 [Prunus dulcis]